MVYGLTINTVGYQMGFQNGLYAFTAAVLGGIGNIPGAMLGGLVIGMVRALGSGYVGERWTTSLIFAILILILVFKPSGLLGYAHARKSLVIGNTRHRQRMNDTTVAIWKRPGLIVAALVAAVSVFFTAGRLAVQLGRASRWAKN